jgi:hypothetical protein
VWFGTNNGEERSSVVFAFGQLAVDWFEWGDEIVDIYE